MATADVKVIVTGTHSETITVRGLHTGEALLIAVDDDGAHVFSLASTDEGIAALDTTLVDEKDPGAVEE